MVDYNPWVYQFVILLVMGGVWTVAMSFPPFSANTVFGVLMLVAGILLYVVIEKKKRP